MKFSRAISVVATVVLMTTMLCCVVPSMESSSMEMPMAANDCHSGPDHSGDTGTLPCCSSHAGSAVLAELARTVVGPTANIHASDAVSLISQEPAPRIRPAGHAFLWPPGGNGYPSRSAVLLI